MCCVSFIVGTVGNLATGLSLGHSFLRRFLSMLPHVIRFVAAVQLVVNQ